MSSNSLESLLAWMKEDSRMLGWGLVVAFERRKANLLIAQEYIRRFGAHSYLPAIKGEVPIVENQWMEYIHDFVMDVPRLSFENASLNDSKAMLTMAVMGGSQITLKKESAGWKANKVDEIDPLQGPKLYLDLLLNQVPGDVETDGRIKLDLSKSDNFRLTFGQTSTEQRMGGDFFKDLFNQLPDEQRVYPLGAIQRGTHELMNPKSFELRTQARSLAARDPQSAEYGEGAILALVRTIQHNGGNYPGSGYKYLIPDDAGSDYSATVLFNRRRAAGEVLIDVITRALKSDGFDYSFDADGEVTAATARSGSVTVMPLAVGLPFYAGGKQYFVSMAIEKLVFPAGKTCELKISFVNDKLVLDWSTETLALASIKIDEYHPEPYEMRCAFDLHVEYELVVGAGGEVLLVQTVYDFKKELVAIESKGDGASIPELLMVLIVIYLTSRIFDLSVDTSLKLAFQSRLTPQIPMNKYIDEVIKLNFGHAIQGDEIFAPHDIGYFGRINPTQTTFMVSPMELLLQQNTPRQFTTDPVVPGVEWAVENLVEGAGSPGTIDSSGLYQAPSAITGRFTRVRVTATALDTGYFSSALVTVVANELTVNPLIQVCDVGATVELSAGQLGTGTLQWSIKNPVPGESGEVRPSVKPEGDHTYHHGPVVANKTFVLDEIEVKSASGTSRSVQVLALQKQPSLTVSIGSLDLAKGQVQLQAIVNGSSMDAEWSIASGGPGSIDATGLYRAAPNATERFVLIFALVDGGPFGKFEGYLILPLPLVEFPRLLEVLSQ